MIYFLDKLVLTCAWKHNGQATLNFYTLIKEIKMQDNTKIRLDIGQFASRKQQDILIQAGLTHPEALEFRICVGIGEDYVEGLFEDHKGDYTWVNLGSEFYH